MRSNNFYNNKTSSGIVSQRRYIPGRGFVKQIQTESIPSIMSKTVVSKEKIGNKSSKKSLTPVSPEITPSYAKSVSLRSYLGKRGYTVPKDVLSDEDIIFIKYDLTVSPDAFGPSYGAASSNTSFPVYRESTKKIYLPRFYGEHRYGLPANLEIPARGTDIDLTFTASLRDYQNEIVDVYMRHSTAPISAESVHPGNGGILEVKTGRGKCLGRNTRIMMYDGSIKLVQDVRVGDLLMGDDSMPRTVLSLARGREMMYKITPTYSDDGTGYIVNESHILSLKYTTSESVVDISILDYLVELGLRNDVVPYLSGYRMPTVFFNKDVPVEPYILGRWLCGDTFPRKSIPIDFLRKYNLLECKHIPLLYKCNSPDVQMALLCGILESSMKTENCGCTIMHSNLQFIDDIIYLARSLGCVVVKHRGINIDIVWISVHYRDNKFIIDKTSYSSKYEIRVERLIEDDYYGFEIDGNRRFMLGDYTITHNTVMALKIVSLIRQKTLIIVHKEFLADQWKERIDEFLPGARVGRIQGSTFDVDDKDIVIGMVQTLYNREFLDTAFSDFGLTIIDEVHRIGSEEFSKTLLRIVTPNMLGISATVDRKDGLDKLLYMFIGDKIYKDVMQSDDNVCVRAIEYISHDPDFNEVALDFRGNPAFSTMISKLSSFFPRLEFIVRVIADLISESPDSQIMVLAHQRNMLTYMHNAIEKLGIASVGYYVGGMKQVSLKETETRQIVLATFSMAAEALDIKTLSTLFMVTPKSDIVQSVGRILRAKHATPIIVDIVDKHDLFKNQFIKRKKFYRSNNYRIRSINSEQYSGFKSFSNWKTIFVPKSTDNALNISSSQEKEYKTKTKNEDEDEDDDEDEENGMRVLIPGVPRGTCMIDM
jgi:superfamily II DNA or RNA helicase